MGVPRQSDQGELRPSSSTFCRDAAADVSTLALLAGRCSAPVQTCRLENGLIKQSFALTFSCVAPITYLIKRRLSQ